MTDIQVKYWTNKENVRHNQEMERLAYVQQKEAERHNRAVEQNLALQANITQSHNLAMEENSALQAKIASRNVAVQEALLPSNIALNEARKYQTTNYGDLQYEQIRGARADSDVKEVASWYANFNTGVGAIDSAVKGFGRVLATFDSLFS